MKKKRDNDIKPKAPLPRLHENNSATRSDVKNSFIVSQHLLPLLLILIVSIAVYANTLKNGFVYDDSRTVVNNTFIKDLGNLAKLFNRGYFLNEGEISYRPIVTLSYFIDYSMYGLNPWGYLLTNIILHAVNAIAFYIFLTLLIKNTGETGTNVRMTPYLISSLFFITHPVLTEAVNGISNREDLLAFLFYMATLNIYLFLRTNSNSSSLPYLVSCLLYFVALLSKEISVTLPLIICCYEWVYRDKSKKIPPLLFNRLNIGYIAVTLFYLYFRFFIFYNPLEGERPAPPFSDRLLTIPWIIASYLKLTIFPVSLSAEYMLVPIKSIFIFFFLSLCIFPLFIFRRKEVIFGYFMFLVTLIPTVNLIPTANPIAERTLYLPVTGFAIISGVAIHKLLNVQTWGFKIEKHSIFALFAIIIALFSFNVLSRNTVWQNNISFFSDTVKKMPRSSRIHYSFGCAYLSAGRLQDAEKEFHTTLELSPNYLDAHTNLGVVYYKQRRLEEAIKQFNSVLKLKPDHAIAYNNLANIYSDMGKTDEAIQLFQTALDINPKLVESHYGIALNYLKIGIKNMAKRELEITLSLKPYNGPQF